MHFTKMQGAGNDFIVINNMDESIPSELFPAIARALCKRRLSIGADGLMIVGKPSGSGDFYMHFYNSDGTEGEMCGNGARCISRYGYEKGLAGETIRVETKSGLVIGKRKSQSLYTIRLNDPSVLILDTPVTVNGTDYECAYVELGTPGLPHAVVHLPGLQPAEDDAIREIGRSIRFWHGFPKGANVNFYDLQPDGIVNELTFERGVEDFTLACGTGSGSVTTVLAAKGLLPDGHAILRMPGGTLEVSVSVDCSKINSETENTAAAAKDIYLTGPAVIVAEGEVGEVLPML